MKKRTTEHKNGCFDSIKSARLRNSVFKELEEQCREARRQRLIAEETANNKVEKDLVEESKRKSSDEVPENIVRTGNLLESSPNCDSIPVIAKAKDDAFENHRFDKKNFVDSQLDKKAKN